ncbi:021R [Invertebrate iridescent virus Kaz2018]|uniref:021R n=1 Tax=Invertebrate iridescent virus 6 TaxID=176652 RepID=Q91G74_IIV6|nr:021R [Invertebrate iridescent virus 6]AAK81958.1 021R [Invertebrate iridescent virus 6]QMS79697.1 hypothetical protein IIV6-T1_023 [Invertebrate iridescent virus 6]QNH08429.1 021R [Invertebrate iridescent virus Kaz2018]
MTKFILEVHLELLKNVSLNTKLLLEDVQLVLFINLCLFTELNILKL